MAGQQVLGAVDDSRSALRARGSPRLGRRDWRWPKRPPHPPPPSAQTSSAHAVDSLPEQIGCLPPCISQTKASVKLARVKVDGSPFLPRSTRTVSELGAPPGARSRVAPPSRASSSASDLTGGGTHSQAGEAG